MFHGRSNLRKTPQSHPTSVVKTEANSLVTRWPIATIWFSPNSAAVICQLQIQYLRLGDWYVRPEHFFLSETDLRKISWQLLPYERFRWNLGKSFRSWC
jgi:hypothetical protein